jgi:hypothetical protein
MRAKAADTAEEQYHRRLAVFICSCLGACSFSQLSIRLHLGDHPMHLLRETDKKMLQLSPST